MGETTCIVRHWKKKVSIAQDFIELFHHIVLLYMRYLSVLIIRSFLRSKAMEAVLEVLVSHHDLKNSIFSSSFFQDPKDLGTALLGI